MVWFDLWLVATLAVSVAAAVPPSQNSTSAVPPSKDPFYIVPPGIGTFAPGAIIGHRKPPSPIAAFGFQSGKLQDAYQILYRTTDSLDAATATVLTVLVPKNPDYNKVLSFQVAEDAAFIDCAPSYGFLLAVESRPLLNSATIQVQLLLIEGALARGFIVIVADVEGPKGVTGINKFAGKVVLDGIRAALASGPFTGIAANPTVALWGYSGGSTVTLAAAGQKKNYAPELDLAGAAIGGLPARNSSAVLAINKGPSAELIPIHLLGLANQYPEVKDLISQHLKPEFKDIFYKPLTQCLEPNMDTFRNMDILGMFDVPNIFDSPVITSLLNDNSGASAPDLPFFWYQSIQDDLAPIADIDAQVREYCAAGLTVEYERNDAPDVTHTNYGLIGASSALTWLEGLLDGETPEPGCSSKTVQHTEVDPGFLNLFPKYIQDALLDFGLHG